MTPSDIERMAREAGLERRRVIWTSEQTDGVEPEELRRFAALVRAQAEAEAHAAIDASPAKIIRNSAQAYPGGGTPNELTLVDRIKELSQYAADWKRWCMEAEESAKVVRAQALEQAARLCESRRQAWLDEAMRHAGAGDIETRDLLARQAYGNGEAAAAIRALAADPAP